MKETFFINYPVIETNRFIMRNFKDSDVADVFSYYSDKKVTENTQSLTHQTIQETEELVKMLSNSYINKKGIAWCIEEKKSKKVIGNIGIFNISKDGYRAEIGFILAKPYWGQGFGTEMVKKAIDCGILDMGLNRIQATCKEQNIASSRVMEKAGMVCEGILREYSFKNGLFFNVKM